MNILDDEHKELNFLIDHYEKLLEQDKISLSDGGSGGMWLKGLSFESLCVKLLYLNDEMERVHIHEQQCVLFNTPPR